jgi:hypothetical protein
MIMKQRMLGAILALGLAGSALALATPVCAAGVRLQIGDLGVGIGVRNSHYYDRHHHRRYYSYPTDYRSYHHRRSWYRRHRHWKDQNHHDWYRN